jgi:Flp pilus assembly protein TadB
MLFAVAALGGVAAYLLTGWLVLVILIPVVLLALPLLLADPPQRQIELLAALDRWIRSLIASLQSGKSIPEAIKSTYSQAPEIIAEQVELLAMRLSERWTLPEALSAFAEDCADADVDAVAAALIVAGQRGGLGAGASLNAIADSIQERLAVSREIAAERAKPRVVSRQVCLITLSVVAFSALTSPGYFAAYNTPIGSVILLVLVLTYLGALFKLRSCAATPPRARILSLAPREITAQMAEESAQIGGAR